LDTVPRCAEHRGSGETLLERRLYSLQHTYVGCCGRAVLSDRWFKEKCAHNTQSSAQLLDRHAFVAELAVLCSTGRRAGLDARPTRFQSAAIAVETRTCAAGIMDADILVTQLLLAGFARRRVAGIAMAQFCATTALQVPAAVTMYKNTAGIARRLPTCITEPDRPWTADIVDAPFT
jgi:hypothetical protein